MEAELIRDLYTRRQRVIDQLAINTIQPSILLNSALIRLGLKVTTRESTGHICDAKRTF
jgi:hypothetical protein